MLPPSSLVISQGWGLIDLPLRASNEGLLRPRVARAQKIIRLHPLLCSGSKGSARVSFHPIHRAASASKKDGLAVPLSPFSGRAFREHRRSSRLPSHPPTELAHFSLKGVAWIGPQLRTSNDHSFIVGVP
jgi:hypothetical protein